MGIETATLAAIGSLLGGGAAAFSALTAKKPSAQAAPAPEAPPAAAKTPDRMSVKRKTADTVGAGATSSTLLTGPAGVELDAGILGRNTLLGG